MTCRTRLSRTHHREAASTHLESDYLSRLPVDRPVDAAVCTTPDALLDVVQVSAVWSGPVVAVHVVVSSAGSCRPFQRGQSFSSSDLHSLHVQLKRKQEAA